MRVVVQRSPTLYSLYRTTEPEEKCPQHFGEDGVVYHRVKTCKLYIM